MGNGLVMEVDDCFIFDFGGDVMAVVSLTYGSVC